MATKLVSHDYHSGTTATHTCCCWLYTHREREEGEGCCVCCCEVSCSHSMSSCWAPSTGSLDQLKDSSLLGLPGARPATAPRSPGCLRVLICMSLLSSSAAMAGSSPPANSYWWVSRAGSSHSKCLPNLKQVLKSQ